MNCEKELIVNSTIQEENKVRKSEERPFISVNVSGVFNPWLADSGASVTVMDETLYEKKFSKKTEMKEIPKEWRLMSASDHPLRPKGIFKGKFQILSYEVEHSVIVVEKLRSGAIMGTDFMKRTGAVIDIKKREVRFPYLHQIMQQGMPEEAIEEI